MELVHPITRYYYRGVKKVAFYLVTSLHNLYLFLTKTAKGKLLVFSLIFIAYILFWNLWLPVGFKWAKKSKLKIKGKSGSTREVFGFNEEIRVAVKRDRMFFGLLPSSYCRLGKCKDIPIGLIHKLFLSSWIFLGLERILDEFLFK